MPGWAKILSVVVFVVCGAGLLRLQLSDNDVQSILHLSGNRYSATVLRTPDELERGLSGTSNLPEGHAMLFVFPSDDKWAIWMKDMNYPIDIVWLDNTREVIHLVKDAQPSSYPDTRFIPQTNARYVIELPSGTIERTGIKMGDKATLPSGV